MKIKKCYISSFGKIKDYTIEFNDGVTNIYEENGWGKSTLATFIKAMFYGLADTKKNIVDNERKHFKPWNSTERFGGYIIVERNGAEYKIERYFGNKESEDSVSVIDTATGKSYKIDNMGERFFQIDEEGFFSTTYFTQDNLEVKSSASITAKYNKTYEIQDSSLYNQAIKKLEDREKELNGRTEKALINQTKAEIRDLKAQLELIKTLSLTIKSLTEEENALKKEVEELKLDIKKISDQIEVAGKKEANIVKKQNYEALVKEYECLFEKNKIYYSKLNGNIEKAKRVEDYYVILEQLNELTLKQKTLAEDINDIKNLHATKNANKKGKINPILVAGIGGILLGVILFFVNLYAGIGCGALGLILTLYSIFANKSATHKDNNALLTIISSKEQELVQISDLHQKTKDALDGYLSNFKLESAEYLRALKEIEQLFKDCVETDSGCKQLLAEINNFKSQKDIFETFAEVEDVKSLKKSLDILNDKYSEKVRHLADKRSRKETHLLQMEKQREFEEELLELTEKLKEYEKEDKVLSLTLKYLKQADENLKIKYREPLEKNLNRILKEIIKAEISASIDINFNVTIANNGMQMDVNYFSKGYKNLVDICKRFALIDVLFVSDKPFVILDDPFVNLDDSKLEEAKEVVKKLSKEYQIIYLVCHESRRI